jgi:hypothetical protein
MTLLQSTIETSRHITEGQLLNWIVGIGSTVLILLITSGIRVISKNTKVIGQVKELLASKSQKIDDMQMECTNKHKLINNTLAKHTEQIDDHQGRFVRVETKLNL